MRAYSSPAIRATPPVAPSELLDGMVMLGGCDAVGLVSDRERCAGVHVLPRSRSAAARTIPADLVIDAMGAGSRLYPWVDDLWRIQVPSDQQMITRYASRLYQLSAGSLPAATIIALRSAQPYCAAVMAVENGQYVVTIADPNIPPCDSEEFDELLRDLLPQQVAAALARGQPAGPVIMSASARIRRRFDDADRLPRMSSPAGCVAAMVAKSHCGGNEDGVVCGWPYPTNEHASSHGSITHMGPGKCVGQARHVTAT
jgi:hypothetical protein